MLRKGENKPNGEILKYQKRIPFGVGGNDGEILRNGRWDEQIRIYEETHRKHHHGLANYIQSVSAVHSFVIGVVLRALSALRTQRYDRRHCGKKDG